MTGPTYRPLVRHSNADTPLLDNWIFESVTGKSQLSQSYFGWTFPLVSPYPSLYILTWGILGYHDPKRNSRPLALLCQYPGTKQNYVIY